MSAIGKRKFVESEWKLIGDDLEESMLARVEVCNTYLIVQEHSGLVLILMAPSMLSKGEDFAWYTDGELREYGDALRHLAEVSDSL